MNKDASLEIKQYGYVDLGQHMERLDEAGLLCRINEPINKDTELHPLVRWQFRGGIPEEKRKAFLFTNVIDSKGKRYDIDVVVGALAANPEIYRIGMNVANFEDIGPAWENAIANPIPPIIVNTQDAPCHEIIIQGSDLEGAGNGLESIPFPISTPGFDAAPYITAACVTTRDPDTGIQNMGTYRGQIKSPTRLGMMMLANLRAGGLEHWKKYKARGEKMPVAIVIGCPPFVNFQGPQKLPIGLDELSVAGGLAGEPIRAVKGHTVDILVPAESEVVIEGLVDTEFLEPEGPFGESHGYVALEDYNTAVTVTAITRRKKATIMSIISQVTPSARGSSKTEIWRALNGTMTLQAAIGKYIIAIDDDIDPNNIDAVLWAMSYRCDPGQDIQIVRYREMGHGPRSEYTPELDSAMLIDATMKYPMPPLALPKKEYMENAKKIWEKIGLPELRPEAPWYGYDLGDWSEQWDDNALQATQGNWMERDQDYIKRRSYDAMPNMPVKRKTDTN